MSIANDERRCRFRRIGKSSFCLLVFGLTVNNYGVTGAAKSLRCFPHLFHEHTGRIILIDRNSFLDQTHLILIGRSKGRNDDDVVLLQLIPVANTGFRVNKRLAPVSLKTAQASRRKIFIHKWIVNQFAEQINPTSWVLGKTLVSSLDRILDAETKAEVTRHDIRNGTKIERSWRR